MKHIFSVLLFFVVFVSAKGQDVVSGDANNNGIVDHFDILNIGYAFGTVGPALMEHGEDGVFEIAVFWEEYFPDGLNYAFADTNGDGLVDWLDFISVFTYYGEEHMPVQPVGSDDGIPGVDIPLYFGAPQGGLPLTAGSQISVPVYLGTADIPVSELHGLALTLEFNSDFCASVDFEFDDSWLKLNSAFLFEAPQVINEDGSEGIGKMDLAMTHFGPDSTSSGYGQIGTMNIIIEDVLVGLLPVKDSIDVLFSVKEVLLLNGDPLAVPVVKDTLEVMVYHPEALVANSDDIPMETDVHIFPNPSSSSYRIYSNKPIEKIEVYGLLGNLISVRDLNGKETCMLDATSMQLKQGTYILIVYTGEEIIKKKVVYMSD
ncbi:MAG: T9SS type A sorting domain-containing protein [Chitinophagales bacterium]|nr:T9SS type A sorting domain-containing protein [Chitinophagales bacterium]